MRAAREEEFALAAVQPGLRYWASPTTRLGPTSPTSSRTCACRLDQLDGYVAAVRNVREKFAGRLRVHLGLECEAFPEYFSWLRELRAEKGFDYFILGNHYDTNDETGGFYFGRCTEERQARRYMETTIAGMQSGLFIYLAHPDLFLNRYPRFDAEAKAVCREICAEAKRLNMPLEYNLLGARRNPGARAAGCMATPPANSGKSPRKPAIAPSSARTRTRPRN